MDKASVERAITIEPQTETLDQTALACSYLWNASATRVTCNPAQQLSHDTTYRLRIDGAAKDEAGNFLGSPFSLAFQTVQETVTVTSTGFSIPRYTDYPTLTMYNVTVEADETIEAVRIGLECIEDTFENLPMDFWTIVDLDPGSQTVRVPYADGFPYMTDYGITCYLDTMYSPEGPPIDFNWK